MSYSANIYDLLEQEGEPKVVAKAPAKVTQAVAPSTTQPKTISQSSATKNQAPKFNTQKGPTNKPPRQQRERLGGDQPETSLQPVETARRDRNDNQKFEHKRADQRQRTAPAGGFTGNKRVSDRKDGTGRGRETQRKNGGGKGDWGAIDDNIEQEVEGVSAKEAEEVVEEVPKEETEEEKQKREEREKEEKQITLDEYLKNKKAAAVSALPEARKANEGVDPKEAKKWGQYEIKKKSDEEEEEETKRERKNKTSTVRVDEILNIKTPPRPRNDDDSRPFRGGRGGARGGRGGSRGGRGAFRGTRGGSDKSTVSESHVPVFSDKDSFPTLASN